MQLGFSRLGRPQSCETFLGVSFFRSSLPTEFSSRPTLCLKCFRFRWAPVFPASTDWARLDRYETAGKKLDQAPYGELDQLMTRLYRIGTPSVQTAFAYGMTKWLASPYASGRRIDAIPFQKFWLVEETVRLSKGVEDMSIFSRRRALADFLCAYYEVVAHVRHNELRVESRH